MEHEDFPVLGFEFMNEPATEEQKLAIARIAREKGINFDPDGPWPDPFSKWDATRMIDTLNALDDCG